jgi:hypothetical protein
VSAKAKTERGRTAVAQAAALERARERRLREIEETADFVEAIKHRTYRRMNRLEQLAERQGYEARPVRRVVVEGVQELSAEIQRLPQSGRALRRLQRGEAVSLLATIKKLVRRQGRLETLLANEAVWRRQLQKRLKTTDTVLPLLHAGNLDRLEELLSRRRGKRGVNRHAQMLGCLRAEKHPYSKEHYAALGRKGGPRRWAKAKEKANGEHERATGT